MTQKAISYNSSDEHMQALLRLALFEAWNGRCHWCRRAASDATYLEIDHILPQSRYSKLTRQLTKEDKKAYRNKHVTFMQGLPDSPDDVQNLAPICAAGRRCNQEKTNAIDSRTFGAIRTSLKKASKLCNKVKQLVQEKLDAQGVEKHLVGLIGMPTDERTRRLVRSYGQFVLRSIWQVDRNSFDQFRTPTEISLDVDLGMVPDFFSDATRTGSGVDGLLYLDDDERVALIGAQVLFEVNASERLAEAARDAVEEVDREVEAELRVEYADLEGPRWLRVVDHKLLPGECPQFHVTLEMTLTMGGEAVSGSDQDGNPRIRHRSVSIAAEIHLYLILNTGEVETSLDWSVTDRD